MNVFQTNYDNRLRSWYDLRKSIENKELEAKCIEIDSFWQNAPLVNHHLHTLDTECWPNPWELLVENTYCYVARGLGICYTLYLSGIKDFSLVEATDQQAEDVVLVLVTNAKYILNYWPNSVISSNLSEFKIKRQIDIAHLLKKL